MSIECPFCKLQIESDAVRCPHCTSNLTGFQANRSKQGDELFGYFIAIGVLCIFQWILAWFWSIYSGVMPKASYYWFFKWVYDAFFWCADLISVIISWPLSFFGLAVPIWITLIALSILISKIFTSDSDWTLAILFGVTIAVLLLSFRFFYGSV